MENAFVSEGVTSPVTLEGYLRKKYEGQDLIIEMSIAGSTHRYFAKWLSHRRRHRLLIEVTHQENKPVLRFSGASHRSTTVYTVCP